MSDRAWMIYGATGYSGGLLAEQAVRQGLRPVLAGRNAPELEALAARLKLQSRVFDLTDPGTVAASLADIDLVIHCAGPFSATSAPMICGCLTSRTHYFDITGEISVFQAAHAQHEAADAAGIVLCPGVGFDVIPTDCVASTLSQALPDATHLALGFSSASAMSPGTAKTALEGMAEGTKIREAGKIVEEPFGLRVREIDYGSGLRLSTPIPWGDVATAYYSTGITNIEVYVPASRRTLRAMRIGNYLRFLFRRKTVQNMLKARIEKTVRGPSAEQRGMQRAQIWGEVRNAAGDVRTARLETPNAYDVTVSGPLAIVEQLLTDPPESGGYLTPSLLMGADFVSQLPGAGPIELSQESAP